MKANAPEKIYISTNSQDGTYYISNQYKRLIEYTHTDAFIEKAKKWFEKQNEWRDINGIKHCVIAWQYKPKIKKYIVKTDSLYNIGDWIEIKQ